VFFILGVLLLVFAVYFQIQLPWISYIGYGLMVLAAIYAIYQWIANERLFKSIEAEKKPLL
jgi:disulfide bond formation protein DsbB